MSITISTGPIYADALTLAALYGVPDKVFTQSNGTDVSWLYVLYQGVLLQANFAVPSVLLSTIQTDFPGVVDLQSVQIKFS